MMSYTSTFEEFQLWGAKAAGVKAMKDELLPAHLQYSAFHLLTQRGS